MDNVLYIIKVTAKAKNNNPNFAEKTNIYLYGKGQMLLVKDLQVPCAATVASTNYFIKHCGYKRIYEAICATKFWDKYNEGHKSDWTYSTEIISKELEKIS